MHFVNVFSLNRAMQCYTTEVESIEITITTNISTKCNNYVYGGFNTHKSFTSQSIMLITIWNGMCAHARARKDYTNPCIIVLQAR